MPNPPALRRFNHPIRSVMFKPLKSRMHGSLLAMAASTALLAVLLAPGAAFAGSQPRIKDIVDVENVRSNQLVGYGLVVGLQGTGDRIRNIPFTEETLQAMLERMGVNIRGTQMLTQNVAAVTVTATMPPYARAGSAIDVQVSALGDSTSLQGGILLVSSLRALDGEIYAVAQGPVAVSGFKAQGAAAKLSRGVMTTARIAGGAIVEREVPYDLRSAQTLKLALKNPDFTTARQIAATINREAPGSAQVLDPGTVELDPAGGSVIDLITRVENLPVQVDQVARIVINEAAGTVVMGADVRVSPVAIAQGGLTISVTETPVVSQPAPFSNGQTTVVPRTQVQADDGSGAHLAVLNSGTSLQTLVAGLNSLGVSPRDLITILQALRTAGALQAEIAVQ